jgi:hypothetical protein
VAGPELALNVDARGGDVSVEVLDSSGEPIPGFTRDEALIIQDLDGLRVQPRWDGRADLAGLVGRTVRLRFYMRKAKLYAFQIRQ